MTEACMDDSVRERIIDEAKYGEDLPSWESVDDDYLEGLNE
jgi:hypothetical protein